MADEAFEFYAYAWCSDQGMDECGAWGLVWRDLMEALGWKFGVCSYVDLRQVECRLEPAVACGPPGRQ